MKTIAFAALVLLSAQAVAQAPAGTTEVTADSCKLYLPSADAKGASRIRWSGQCKDGLADGRGIVRIYSGGKISRISETTFAAGKIASAGEAYFIKGGQAVRSRGGDQLEIAASELPTWALELSMLVEDRPVRAAPSRPAPSSTRVAEEKAAADKAKAEAAKAEAEAKKAAAEAKAVADKKAADEKAAAAKAAKEAEAKRVAAQKERAAAQAKALTEKRAAEKAAAEAKAAADAKALTEARAAAERAAAAEKLAQEKAAAEAKAAVEAKAAAEAKTAADAKAAADAKGAAEAKAAADAKAAAEAKAAMDKLAAQRAAQSVGSFVPGRGFGDGGTGEALRGVMTFKLTTDDGRTYGVATFVAGKGEAAIKQNAIALAQVYEKVSPFHAKLLEQPEILTTCGGPGYVVEARLTYPATKTYGWFAGCMGDNIEGTAKAIQQIEDAMHKDFKATPTSFWAYQYLIIGHVDETGIRSRAEYERVARPNLMAPGRVMVLSRPDQWAECTTVANKDPKLKDKVACLKEAMEKLKPSNPLGAR